MQVISWPTPRSLQKPLETIFCVRRCLGPGPRATVAISGQSSSGDGRANFLNDRVLC